MGKFISDHANDASSLLITNNYKKKDKTTFPGETSTFYLQDDTGTTKGFIGLIRDVFRSDIIGGTDQAVPKNGSNRAAGRRGSP